MFNASPVFYYESTQLSYKHYLQILGYMLLFGMELINLFKKYWPFLKKALLPQEKNFQIW